MTAPTPREEFDRLLGEHAFAATRDGIQPQLVTRAALLKVFDALTRSRDEAYERAARVCDQIRDGLRSKVEHPGEYHQGCFDAADAIGANIRALAGGS